MIIPMLDSVFRRRKRVLRLMQCDAFQFAHHIFGFRMLYVVDDGTECSHSLASFHSIVLLYLIFSSVFLNLFAQYL